MSAAAAATVLVKRQQQEDDRKKAARRQRALEELDRQRRVSMPRSVSVAPHPSSGTSAVASRQGCAAPGSSGGDVVCGAFRHNPVAERTEGDPKSKRCCNAPKALSPQQEHELLGLSSPTSSSSNESLPSSDGSIATDIQAQEDSAGSPKPKGKSSLRSQLRALFKTQSLSG